MSKNSLIIYLSIIYININIIFSEKILKIPFRYDSTSKYYINQSDPLINKFMSQLLIEISIGTPPQKLNCSLNLNNFHSFFIKEEISKYLLDSYYNKSQSHTYNCTKSSVIYWDEDFTEADIFSDNISLFSKDNKNILNNRFTFLLINELKYTGFYAPGIIGLRLENENGNKQSQINENRFIYQIKKNGLTNSETFYFDFNNNDENGNFIIGEELESLDDTYYKSIYAGIIKLSIYNFNPEWAFNFDTIYYGNKIFSDNYSKDALIKSEYGLTIGPTNYENIINEFFKNENKCSLYYTKVEGTNFKYYSCEEDFDETKMDDLIFELKSINFNFTFHGKDLFFTENKKKYFKILFVDYYSQTYWYLGREFLKKYRLRFNPDKKLIYIPLGNNETKSTQKSNKKSIFKQAHTWIIFSFGIVIIGLIVFIVFYLKKYPRKKRANELIDDDNYDYTQKDDINSNIN